MRISRSSPLLLQLRLLALTAAAFLFTCEPVPDYCGSGIVYEPSCEFCYGNRPYRLCENEKREYSPLVRGCTQTTDVIGARCSDGSVVPLGTPCGGYMVSVAVLPKGVEGIRVDRGDGGAEDKTLTANFTLTNAGGGGGSYESVTIGGRTWMKKNLNVETSDSWCYGNSADSCAKYGRLYTWNAAKTACPKDWHLPSREEWNALESCAGGYSVAGKHLKSSTSWNAYSGIENLDTYGFSALPGGYRNYSDGSFINAGYSGNWWTATEYDSGYAYGRYMGYDGDFLSEGSDGKEYGFSVRCVRD